MGKRLKVRRDELPKVDLKELRDPNEKNYKLFGVFLPMVFYAVVIGLTIPGVGPLDSVFKVTQNLLYWLILGGVVLLVLSGSHKGKIKKRWPHSKVAGTIHQDIRMRFHQLCRLLDIKKMPEIYIIDSKEVAAMVRGMGSPYLVISKRLVDVLKPNEFDALIATLLGHVKAGTVFWRNFILTLSDANGLLQFVCLPYVLMTKLMGGYLDASQHTADRVALLLIGGDYHLLTMTLIKTVTYSSGSLSDEQRQQLQRFLEKSGLEAKAEDVGNQILIGQMMRAMPDFRDRLEIIKNAESEPAMERELIKMDERKEKLAPATVRA